LIRIFFSLSSYFKTFQFKLLANNVTKLGVPGNRTPLYNMSEEHKMTQQDRLVLTITLAAIFFGVFGLGLIGLIINLSS